VGAIEANRSAEHVGEIVEVDFRIGQLGLGCDRPVRAQSNFLAAFDAKAIAKAVVAARQTEPGGSRRQIAVVPAHLRLAIKIKAAIRVPGQRAAQAVTGAADRAIAKYGGNIGGYGSVMAGDAADQATGL